MKSELMRGVREPLGLQRTPFRDQSTHGQAVAPREGERRDLQMEGKDDRTMTVDLPVTFFLVRQTS